MRHRLARKRPAVTFLVALLAGALAIGACGDDDDDNGGGGGDEAGGGGVKDQRNEDADGDGRSGKGGRGKKREKRDAADWWKRGEPPPF